MPSKRKEPAQGEEKVGTDPAKRSKVNLLPGLAPRSTERKKVPLKDQEGNPQLQSIINSLPSDDEDQEEIDIVTPPLSPSFPPPSPPPSSLSSSSSLVFPSSMPRDRKTRKERKVSHKRREIVPSPQPGRHSREHRHDRHQGMDAFQRSIMSMMSQHMSSLTSLRETLDAKVGSLAGLVEAGRYNSHTFSSRVNQKMSKHLQAIQHLNRVGSKDQVSKLVSVLHSNIIDLDISGDYQQADFSLDAELKNALPDHAPSIGPILRMPPMRKRTSSSKRQSFLATDALPVAHPITQTHSQLPTFSQLQQLQNSLPQSSIKIAHVGHQNKAGHPGCHWCTSKGSPQPSTCHFLKANPSASSYQL